MEIPGYKIHREHGKGGMATVYLATQESLDREVALKVMQPQAGTDKSMCDRFLKEGKIIAKLGHPNIVTIYDIGCYQSHYYMSMEFCAAPNLKERIHSAEGVRNPLQILRQIGDALRCAHSHGFIHRDVKPANILFRDDHTAVLTDFGIAKAMQAETQLTAIGWTVGTPEYMGPEQSTGKELDARADLYSLGVVFYEMLVGKKPYIGADAFATALMHVNEPIPRLPDDLLSYQSLVDRLMAKDPADRFQNGEELIAQIDAILGTPSQVTRVMTELLHGGTGSCTDQDNQKKNRRLLWKSTAAIVPIGLIAAAVAFMPRTAPEKPVGGGGSPGPIIVTPPQEEPTSSLDPARQAKVARLLEIARAHTAIGRIREPSGSNAYEAYRMVLDIDPANREARNALTRIEATAQ